MPGRVVFPVSFLTNILENVRFCNPIQRGNFPQEWTTGYRQERQGQHKGRQGAEAPVTRVGKGGGGHLGAGLGGSPGQGYGTGRQGSGGSQIKRYYSGTGGSPNRGGGYQGGYQGGGRGQRWSPPSPDPRHPLIAAMMNPYLEKTNGKLYLPAILEAGNLSLEDLPHLDKFYNATTGKSGICWSHVLGPCHYNDC